MYKTHNASQQCITTFILQSMINTGQPQVASGCLRRGSVSIEIHRPSGGDRDTSLHRATALPGQGPGAPLWWEGWEARAPKEE